MHYQDIWNKVLRSDEKVEYEFSIGKKYRMLWMITLMVLGLIFLALPVLTVLIILFALLYFGYYLKVANAYAFTNKRIIIHRGWLSTHTVSIEYNHITDVAVTEPFLDRILSKTGHLTINTAGSSANEAILKHISEPYEVRKKLDDIRK